MRPSRSPVQPCAPWAITIDAHIDAASSMLGVNLDSRRIHVELSECRQELAPQGIVTHCARDYSTTTTVSQERVGVNCQIYGSTANLHAIGETVEKCFTQPNNEQTMIALTV